MEKESWEEKIRDELYELFGMGDRDGSYWHILTRVKEARQVGTLTIDDYKELEMDDLEDLINLIRAQREQARREGVEAAIELIPADAWLWIKEQRPPEDTWTSETSHNLRDHIRSKLLNN